jgi:lipopolysaccharide biosynthesis protein
MTGEITTRKKARAIAFYLPQYHPIPENDAWWENGFTEWTNVTKARPLFKGHLQPKLPSELGFYDLRVPETRAAQASLARAHGIEGFCYWHYWFAGKRLLERPFQEVLDSGEPDFPFCLAWANATWTGIWHGAPDRVLIQQDYPGVDDYTAHFFAVLDAFKDKRYITIDGKPVFTVFHPVEFQDPRQFTDLWRELALKSGLQGLYLIGISHSGWDPAKFGYDACCVDYFSTARRKIDTQGFDHSSERPALYPYSQIIRHAFHADRYRDDQHPCVIPNWDNTPRSGADGVIFDGSTPELFGEHLEKAIRLIDHRPFDRRLLFLKSWNEWAEGNYLEPDRQFGRQYLEALHSALTEHPRHAE